MATAEDLQRARNALVDELRSSNVLGVLIVLVFTVFIATVIGTLALTSVWFHYAELRDIRAEQDAVFAAQDQKIQRHIDVMQENMREMRNFYGSQLGEKN